MLDEVEDTNRLQLATVRRMTTNPGRRAVNQSDKSSLDCGRLGLGSGVRFWDWLVGWLVGSSEVKATCS